MMKTPLLTLLLLVALGARATAAPATEIRTQQVAFARGYVSALQSKDKARIVGFFHPTVRACMNDKNRIFFDYIVSQQSEGIPSGKYTGITITPKPPKSEPSIWSFVPAKEFPYPVMPTFVIQVDFSPSSGELFSALFEVAPSGTSWYLAMPCPTADGIRYMQKMVAQGESQKAKAKLLASRVHDPLLSQIKKLLANNDKIGAIKAYQKATGADLTTAVMVVDEIEGTEP